MQKKLMAVAVAGVLAAPAMALAQSSTVQVFGTFYVEYSYIDQGNAGAAGVPNSRQNVDLLQTPGSEIGFKGEEKLGGGLSAWFQCSTTADVRGQSQDGLCGRNSALGLKGGFGNVFIGVWDTPFKRLAGPTNVGGNDTGVFGTAGLLFAGSTTLFGNTSRANFKRRQQNSISYDSPNFGGFQVMAMYSSANNSTSATTGATNNKPRVMSIGGQYSAGPIYVSAAYERHSEFGAPTLAAFVPPATVNDPVGGGQPTVGGGGPGNQDDTGWHVGAAYTWGPVRFGGQYTQQKFDSSIGAAPSELKAKAWHVGVDWNIVGPHGLRAAYTRAEDMKGTPGTAGVAGSQSQARPGIPAAGGNDTGAHMYQIRYVYTMSKRTEFTFGYVKLDNDGSATGGGTYNLFGVGGGTPGNNQDAFAMGLRHTF